MKQELLSKTSIDILADIVKAKRPLSVSKIAERTGFSWKTTNEHIKKLKTRRLIECNKTKRRNYCKATQQIEFLVQTVKED
jgi:DNA-binding transcriptional regulator GbsR (MarR family)